MSSLERQVQRLQAELTQERVKNRSLKIDGGDGTSGGMDHWQASVETRLGQLHGDVRQVLYALIAAAVFLLLGGIAAYNRMDDRLRSVEQTVIKSDGKIDRILDRLPPTTKP